MNNLKQDVKMELMDYLQENGEIKSKKIITKFFMNAFNDHFY